MLLSKALKDSYGFDEQANNDQKETEKFNNLISSWSEQSHKIILMLNKKETSLTKTKHLSH